MAEEGIKITELDPVAVGDLNDILVAVRSGQTVQITVQQLATLIMALIVDGSPAALDTLNELAAALGDDPNFATTVTNSIALKAPLASPALTGTPTAPNPAAGTNNTQIPTTAWVKSELKVPSVRLVTANETYVPTPGARAALFEAVGGGAGGGYAKSTGASEGAIGSGGGAGGFARVLVTTLAASYVISLGAAGVGGIASSSTPATAGGTTTVGAILSAAGGSPGVASNSGSGNFAVAGAAGGLPTVGDQLVKGQPGGAAYRVTGSIGFSGHGGSGPFGGGGEAQGGTSVNSAGVPGQGYGAGGSGAVRLSGTGDANGGAGSPGAVRITEFF